jgi:hypothetical protein
MACFHPLSAFARADGRSGKVLIKFRPPGEAIRLPCGQCIGCRLDRSLHWAVRCMHEASLYEENCFITLTYDDDHLPVDGSLDKAHFQKFMKRLRKRFRGRFIRYFHCGEYGEQLSRPHYHACLFNLDFPDKEAIRELASGFLYRSAILEKCWGHGFCSVGAVTFESAAYVARYCVKKVTGDARFDHYVSPDGVVMAPEYTTMSRRPGIGRSWYEKYSGDVFPWDECIISGRPVKPPRYYEGLYREADLDGYVLLKAKRLEAAERMAADNIPPRLLARERVKLAQCKMLKRGYENEA